ncbi:MAG: M1 family aminopeptidase, partial [Candidatus Thorarchaeota archaeon]
MKSKCQISILFIIFCASASLVFQSEANRSSMTSNKDFFITNDNYKPNQVISPPMVSNAIEFSNYNLSVIFDESTSSVMGNLTVDFYNNDFVNFTRIPFHLFLSGMLYDTRQGNIEILNVTTIGVPKTILSYDVNTTAQLLWVDLETILEPYQRTYFEIQFNSTIPDGGYDRANSHGNDYDSSKIFKFTSFYPMPCVYDKFDGWNIDPYLNACDPFYYDMAYYNLAIEAPNGMIVAGSGKLIEKSTGTSTTTYLFDPELPVREVTFAASRYYLVETMLFKGVNISTYYLPKSSYIWQIDALVYARLSLSLYNDTFGEYPYSNLNLVQEYASTYLGMEYPIQMYASEIIDHYAYPTNVLKQILEKVIVHEVGHQWWYNLVGFDEVDWGFLDEGLTCWTTDYYAEIIHSNWEYFQWDRYLDTVRIYYETNGLPSKLNQSAYDLIENHLDHVFISYRKSPLIFEKIRRVIGDSNFILGLQTFFNQY